MSGGKRRRVNESRSTDELPELNGLLPPALQLPSLPSKVPSPLSGPCAWTPLDSSSGPSESLRRATAGMGGNSQARSIMLVMKFGGSSLAGAEHLQRVAGIIRERLSQRPIVVLSAMGKTTNMLLAAVQKALDTGEVDINQLRKMHEGVLEELGIPVPDEVEELFQHLSRVLSGVALLQEVSARTRDLVVSFGERLSVRVFAAVFNKTIDASGVTAKALDSWEVGMLTSSGFGSADSAHSCVEVLPSAYEDIRRTFEPLRSDYTHVPCVTGYIAKDAKGVITTLGRDGSDLTATVIGVATRATEVQIWKDVSGILTTDPRLVNGAKPVNLLTFEEAAELSSFGAKVVHPAAVLPAWLGEVPIVVRNSMRPQDPGTRIVTEVLPEDNREGKVAAISSKRGIVMIVIKSTRMLGQHGFLARVFQIFDEFEVSVDVITTSEVTVSLTLDRGYKEVDMDGLREKLSEVANVEIKDSMSMLTLLTPKKESSAVLQEAFTVFKEIGVTVEMVSHGASNVNVTFVLSDASLHRCIQRLHAQFFPQ